MEMDVLVDARPHVRVHALMGVILYVEANVNILVVDRVPMFQQEQNAQVVRTRAQHTVILAAPWHVVQVVCLAVYIALNSRVAKLF